LEHTAQRTLPVTAVLPEGQAPHKGDPVAFEKVLASHSVQLVLKVAPLLGFFFPAAHLLQSFTLETPLANEYVPDGHAAQASSLLMRCSTATSLPYCP
jgi:hypothetical protein